MTRRHYRCPTTPTPVNAQHQHPSWPYCNCTTPHPITIFFGLATQCGHCSKPIESTTP